MGKKDVYDRSTKGARQASKDLKKGDKVYVVLDNAGNLAPYENAQLYSAYTVTGQHPLLGGAMIGGYSVEYLVRGFGPLYTQPPKGLRNIATPGPQVAGPLTGDEYRELSRYEIEQAEKQVEANNADRKRKSSWW